MVNSSGQFTPASSDTSILKYQPSCTWIKLRRDMTSTHARCGSSGGLLVYCVYLRSTGQGTQSVVSVVVMTWGGLCMVALIGVHLLLSSALSLLHMSTHLRWRSRFMIDWSPQMSLHAVHDPHSRIEMLGSMTIYSQNYCLFWSCCNWCTQGKYIVILV